MTTFGRIRVIYGNMVTAAVNGRAVLNSAAYCERYDGTKLLGEIVRIRENEVDLQLFEETTGLAVGDSVELSDELISISLGPGMLGSIYDGLQNPLPELEKAAGIHLAPGSYLPGIDALRRWRFTPLRTKGDRVRAGDTLGTVPEATFSHRVMVPFSLKDEYLVEEIAAPGQLGAYDTVAKLTSTTGRDTVLVSMTQRWPIKLPIDAYARRLYPSEPLSTRVRIVDTLFPIARGGTYCIPGPFGAGKTVLQQITARFAQVDVVIVAACGERAGEVVETLTDFPKLKDPRTGEPLMSRTVVICNTSSMPVAAREASVYTAVTIGEYYRQMGLDVLLLADSTSRWAQALREISGRLEEIPGEEAFPAYLESRIANFYERAGSVELNDGTTGSLTIGGAVSPAGGNFEEPVTQGTLKVVGAFLGLSQKRADSRRYPAIDPLDSWSTYSCSFSQKLREDALAILRHGDEIKQMMTVLGEEGIGIEELTTSLKADFIDSVYLQQDAFDPVDADSSLDRQREVFDLLMRLVRTDFRFQDRSEARRTMLAGSALFRDWNTSPFGGAKYEEIRQRIGTFIETKGQR